jgi:hypothetical protein
MVNDGWVVEREAVRLLREQDVFIREGDIQQIFSMQA